MNWKTERGFYRLNGLRVEGELKKLTPTPRTTLRTTPRTTLRTSPRTTMRTTLTNQPNLLSRRKELEEAYLPTRSHLINSRHLDFRHFTRPSSPLASPQSSSATSQSTPFSQSMTTIGAGNSFCYIQLKNVFKNLLIAVLGSHHIFGFTWPTRPLETYSPT